MPCDQIFSFRVIFSEQHHKNGTNLIGVEFLKTQRLLIPQLSKLRGKQKTLDSFSRELCKTFARVCKPFWRVCLLALVV